MKGRSKWEEGPAGASFPWPGKEGREEEWPRGASTPTAFSLVGLPHPEILTFPIRLESIMTRKLGLTGQTANPRWVEKCKDAALTL